MDVKEFLINFSGYYPYGLVVDCGDGATEVVWALDADTGRINDWFECSEVTPYLRPMDDVTQEELYQITELSHEISPIDAVSVSARLVDYMNSRFLDYKDLIGQKKAIPTFSGKGGVYFCGEKNGKSKK